jgi:uncharacterized protein (UPF0276 family)
VKDIATLTSNIWLAADGSPLLFSLIDAGRVTVDKLKVGPWMGKAWLHQCLERQSALLHCNDSLIHSSFNPSPIVELALITETEWVSLHLDVPRFAIFNYWKRFGIPFPLIPRQVGQKLAIEKVRVMQSSMKIPVAIENQAYHRRCGHDYLVEPEFISEIANATDCYLLLDIGHVRVSAAMLGISEWAYLSNLPLDRVIEIHISGPEFYRGRLRDTHGPLQKEDYHLLRAVLPQCPACRAVTLEYYGPAPELEQQLIELHTLLSQYRS